MSDSVDFNKVMTLLLVEEKTRNFPVVAAIHAEAIDELNEISVKLAEEQKKKYEEEQKKKLEEEAAEAARKRKAEADEAAKEGEKEPARVERRF